MVKTLSRLAPSNKRGAASSARTGDVYLAEVVAVTPTQGFLVDVTFSDGTNRRIDLEPYLHGRIFEPIRRDRKLFRAVRVQAGTIGWENGADIDPDTLYYEGHEPWATAAVAPRARAETPIQKQRMRSRTKA